MTLELNRVPAIPIVEVVLDYLSSEGERVADGVSSPAPMIVLAERADVKTETLYSLLKGRTETVDFDVADRLLCAMNLHDIWLTDLREVYEAALLHEGEGARKVERPAGRNVCERRGCSNALAPPPRQGGGQKRRYCSVQCRRRAQIARKREREGREPRYSNQLDKCIHGHDWTEENTYWVRSKVKKDGTHPKRCRTCERERQAAWWKANRSKQNEG